MNTLPTPIRERIEFPNSQGHSLAALLERAPGVPRAYAIFAHCFTCSKDIAAAARISRGLASRGIAVLRFDFTGIGHSDGEFANTNFTSNVQDLIAASDHLRAHFQAPTLLVGHSLGGAAVLAAAGQISEVTAVVTLGAPSDPMHVQHLFQDRLEDIDAHGQATVQLAGRDFVISKQFLEDISQQKLTSDVRKMRKALLVMHSPVDEIVAIKHAEEIYRAALHPKSFVSLDSADHLLTDKRDAAYAAETIAAWAERYLPPLVRPMVADGDVLVRESDGKFGQEVFTDRHFGLADEPLSYGGADNGPSPYEFLSIALGTCTSMTIRMYADRKKIPLDQVSVTLRHSKIHADDCAHCETEAGKIDRIERRVELTGNLTDVQRQQLLVIADKCPVHRTLHAELDVATELVA